jgi:integrase
MPRTVRDNKLDSRTARAGLRTSGAPYYRGIDQGLHIGYRKGKSGGRWVMRWYAGKGGYKVETLGTADDVADADGVAVLSFSQAQAMAREKRVALDRAAKGLPTAGGPYTVRACLHEYLRYLESERKSAKDAQARIDALILPTLGDIVCSRLKKDDITRWLRELATTPPRVRTKEGAAQQHRTLDPDDADQQRKRRNSANRTLSVLRAALNRAWHDGKIASDDPWRRVEPFKEANAARVRYLTIDESRRLINASQGEFRDLVRAALTTGCRFGELAALEVRDLNSDVGTLHIRTSKSGKDRHVVLNDEGIALFTRLAAGRIGTELMLRKADGARWGQNHQNKPMAVACERANIDPPANFHCLRHTWASLSVMAGAPLLVVARNLGHVDTKMVEKHYGHLSDSYIAEAIRAAGPRFGVPEDPSVVPMAAGRIA